MSNITIIEQILRAAGPTFYGSIEHIEAFAQEWGDHFEPDSVQPWIDAGCFDAGSAAFLDAHGVSPSDAAKPYRDGMSIGYAYANGDVSIAQICALLSPQDDDGTDRADYDV